MLENPASGSMLAAVSSSTDKTSSLSHRKGAKRRLDFFSCHPQKVPVHAYRDEPGTI